MKHVVAALSLLVFAGCQKNTVVPRNTLVPGSAVTQADRAAPVPTVPGHQDLSDDMVEIQGDFCPEVEQVCLRWVDVDGNTITMPPGSDGRCGEFRKPSRCLSPKKVPMHYAIDRYEWPNKKGSIPKDWVTWYDAKALCESQGKRLPTRHEWTFACEGPEIQPYPYGDGYHRDKTACNFDNHIPKGIDVFKATSPDSSTASVLRSMLVPAGSNPRCVSPWGVAEMVGNIDEFTVNETGKPYVSSLQGGHIAGVRNRCRASTDAHSPSFNWYETGFRCVRDIQ